MSAPRVQLFEHVGLGVIVSWPSGVVFTNQTGGTSCLAPEMEGIFIPLRNDCTAQGVLVSPENDLWEYFTGPRWGGIGATQGLQQQDADFIDALLHRVNLHPAMSVDRRRLRESHEAWVHVAIHDDEFRDPPLFTGFSPYPRPGILTWQNSD